LSICSKEGIPLENLLSSIASLQPVVGRMEVLQQKPFIVIVDFAHTANSTLNALKSAKKLVKDGSKLIHVFGCAGQRDPGKRFKMGKTSNEYADITILTAEDCRFESLKDINDEIERGWRDGGNKNAKIFRFDDDTVNVEVRRDAILKAFELAQENDVIIITGKSHENSLCFGDVEYDWNDIEEVKKLIN
jgi:UDP-N-acetylmuramoyl-L-alanyl-D-glutamate--2,6-diaminopimelate ligase